jgi:hypothetical protein
MSFKTVSQIQLGQQTAKNSEIVTSSIIVFNSGGAGGVNDGPTIANVVVTDNNFANTFGNITASNCFVKIFGTGFVSNTTVLVNANTVSVSNATYTSTTELRVALPILANAQVVQFNVVNPGVPKFTKTGPPVPSAYSANYLVVAGGGGGGKMAGGGGGGGGLVSSSISLNPGTTYTITVGTGGNGYSAPGRGSGFNGANSSISTSPTNSLVVAIGGGGGGGFLATDGRVGGSGGGGGATSPAQKGEAINFPGPSAQGYPGGGGSNQTGGGGGGAGSSGTNGIPNGAAGPGGSGYTWPFTANTYAGGGGAGTTFPGTTNVVGSGGPGGGGPGTNSTCVVGTAGTTNTGGGGGGGGFTPGVGCGAAGGNGGSGIVILAIPTPNYPSVVAPEAAVTTPPAAPGMTVLSYTTPASANTTYTFTA